MATAPFVVLVYDRVFLSESFNAILKRRGLYYAGLASTWGWLAMLMLSSHGRDSTAGFGMGITAWDYAMTQFGFIVRYLWLTVWPNPLVLDYGTSIARFPSEILPYAFIIVGLLIASLVAFRYQPWIGCLGLTFFVILSPTSSIVPMVTQTAAEHRMYLPLAPLVVLAVMLGRRLIDRIVLYQSKESTSGILTARFLGPCVVLLILFALGTMTYKRNRDYRSELAIWKQTASDYPSNARAHCSAGVAHLKLLQMSESIEHFSRAIELKPEWLPALKNRGYAHLSLGQFQEASADFAQAAEASQDNPREQAEMYYQASLCRENLGRRDEAIQILRRALRTQPDHREAMALMEKWKSELLEEHGTVSE